MSAFIELLVFDEFLTSTTEATGKEELVRVLMKAVGRLGYDRINISTIRDCDLPDHEQKFALYCNYPTDWLEYYAAHNCLSYDPVAQRARGGMDPFFWSELNRSGDLTRGQLGFLGAAADAGLNDGVGLPFQGAPSLTGGIALATSKPDMDHSTNLQILFAISNEFYRHYKKFTTSSLQARLRMLHLPPRQLQVLSELSYGRSNAQIANALGISEHTVNIHLRRLFKALGAHNRVQAVRMATYYGLVDPI